MRKLLILITFSYIIYAKPAVMGGITYAIGGGVESIGTTVKFLSSSKEKKPTLSAGASFYPWAKDKKFGIDIGAGYNFKKATITTGWDILKNEPTVSLGINEQISSEDDDISSGIQDATCKK